MSFTSAQREAIDTHHCGLSVIAAAGSGKTTVLVERYHSLLQQGLEPQQILAVTFTREAAEQLRHRICRLTESNRELQEKVRSSPYIGTIHSFCLHLLRHFGTEVDVPKEILDDVRWHEIFDSVFEKWFSQLNSASLSEGLQLWNPTDIEAIAKEILRNPASVRGAVATSPENEGALAEYWWERELPQLLVLWENHTYHQGLFTFGDLEERALALLEQSETVRTAVQNSFKSYLVDEFQDTSPVQWRILECVLGSQWNRLFIVGDPRQSIYGFRNADVDLFFSAQDRIESLGGKTIQLSTSFRSTPQVIDRINALSSNLFLNTPFATQQMEAAPSGPEDSGEGYFQLFYPCPEKKSAELAQSEIAAVTHYLQKRMQDGALPKNFAVLFRNSDRIPDFAAALEAVGIPCRFRKAEKLFDNYFSWDLLGFLQTVQTPEDDFVCSRFLLSPFVRMPWQELAELRRNKGLSLFDKIKDSKSLKWLGALTERRSEVSPIEALEILFKHSSYCGIL